MGNDAEETCPYEIRAGQEITLVLKCGECGGDASLSSKACFSRILRLFQGHSGIASVILEGSITKRYFSDAISVLGSINNLAIMIDNACGRMPEEVYFSQGKAGKCPSCPARPATIMGPLAKSIYKGTDEIGRSIIDVGGRAKGYVGKRMPYPQCDKCLLDTVSALSEIADFYKGLASSATREVGTHGQ